MTTHIYGYFEDTDDFRLTTVKRWEKSITVSGAKKYLRNHLLKSLQNDFTVAFKAYKKKNVGYFALPRIIFPYITFLGSLYKGEDSTNSSLEFMIEYMGRVSDEYKLRAGIDYVGYRHGLIHTNMPKIFCFGKRKLGWGLHFAKVGEGNRGDFLDGNLRFYPELFFKDLCSAIELFISDFDDTSKEIQLMESFKKGFTEMSRIFKVKDLKGRDFNFAKRMVKKGLRKYCR